MTDAALSKTGERRLADAEAIIERGEKTFMEVGKALFRIRDERLYRADFDTFEDYCQGRWHWTARRGRQLMEAAEIGTIVPVANEGQARALKGLDPDEAIEVFEAAKAAGPVTAATITKARNKIVGGASTREGEGAGDGAMPPPTLTSEGDGAASTASAAPPPSVPTASPEDQYRIALRSALNDALKITTQFPDHDHNLEVQGRDRNIYLSDLRGLARWIDDALNAADGVSLRAVK